MIKQMVRWVMISVWILGLIACSEPSKQKEHYSVTGDSYDFIVLGDNRPNIKHFESFLAGASRLDVYSMVHVGDMIEFSSPVGFLSFQDALDHYLRDDIQFEPVIGNHDMDGSGGNTLASLKLFLNVFNLPSDSKGYRKVEYPSYVFIILNTYYPGYENRIDNEQLQWLDTTLADLELETPSKPIFVFTHHPLFPAGYHLPLSNRDEVNATLMKYPAVKAIFSGHEHLYYHETVTSGSRTLEYYISGGAGGQLHHVDRGLSVYHMLGVRVSPNVTVTLLNENGDPIAL